MGREKYCCLNYCHLQHDRQFIFLGSCLTDSEGQGKFWNQEAMWYTLGILFGIIHDFRQLTYLVIVCNYFDKILLDFSEKLLRGKIFQFGLWGGGRGERPPPPPSQAEKRKVLVVLKEVWKVFTMSNNLLASNNTFPHSKRTTYLLFTKFRIKQ